MKVGAILAAIWRHAVVHACLATLFAMCWFTHHVALLRMEICDRQFAMMNNRTWKSMALIDWVTAHSWLAIAYIVLAFVSVAFLQARRRPAWTWWVTALVYGIPCAVYWSPCAYIAGKFLSLTPFQ